MDERLKQLMDYTKFHIGLYVTLLAGLVVFVSKDFTDLVDQRFHFWLLGTIALFLVAGMAGGLVGSSIPDFESYEAFMKAGIGPWHGRWASARTCIHIEHTAFWLGAIVALIGLLVSTYLKAKTGADPLPFVNSLLH